MIVKTYLPGSSDTVRNWNKLGFIARREIGYAKGPNDTENADSKDSKTYIWVEQERLPLNSRPKN